MSSGTVKPLKILLENGINSQNIWRRVVDRGHLNNSHFKYFLNIAFVRKLSTKLSGCFGCCRDEWVNILSVTNVPTGVSVMHSWLKLE